MKGESHFSTGDCSIFILRLDVVVHLRGIHTRVTSCRLIDNPSGLSSGLKGIALPILERKSPYFFFCPLHRPIDVSPSLDFRRRLVAFISPTQYFYNVYEIHHRKIRRLRYSLFLPGTRSSPLLYVSLPFSKQSIDL